MSASKYNYGKHKGYHHTANPANKKGSEMFSNVDYYPVPLFSQDPEYVPLESISLLSLISSTL